MNLEETIAKHIGDVTIKNMKLSHLVDALRADLAKSQAEVAKRDGTIADLKEQLSAALARANEPELPNLTGAANGARTH